MMTCDTALLLLLEKSLLSSQGLKEEGKYQGKFTNDEFDIQEIIGINTSQEQEVYYVTFKEGL